MNIKIVCDQQLLSESLMHVSRTVALKSTIPSLEGIRIRVTPDRQMQLTGYDLEHGIQTQIQLEPETKPCAGEFVVNTKLFSDIVKRMPESKVKIELDDNYSTKIKSGVAEYNIASMSAEEYPDIPQVDRGKSFEMKQPELKEMIMRTIFAASVTDSKPILTGELFHIVDGNLNLVAIDGYRLAIRTKEYPLEQELKFVVPAKALKEVSNLLSDDPDKVCIISPGRKHIIFTIDNYQVISRMLEGEFHNYQGSIPQSGTTMVEIVSRDLIASLERCSLLVNEKLKAPVRCKFYEKGLELLCETELGKFNELLSLEVTGPEVVIGFNCRYLIDALKASGEDRVRLVMGNGVSPMKIEPIEGNHFTYLVLPVRLK